MTTKMLPPPPDGKELKPPTAAEFFDLSGEEDDALLDTGAWDDQPKAEQTPTNDRRKGGIVIHFK